MLLQMFLMILIFVQPIYETLAPLTRYNSSFQTQSNSIENVPCITTTFLWRDSNGKLSASRSLSRFSFIGLLVNNFMLDRTTSSSTIYFSVSFDGSIVTISMEKSARSCLDISASLGLLQYRCVLIHY